MCLFHLSRCFEQPSAHHQENQLYQYIIWYISGMRVRDLHNRRPPTQSYTYQMMYWYNWFSWWWALGCSKHVEKWNKHIKNYVKLVINTNCTEMHGQHNIKFYLEYLHTHTHTHTHVLPLCICEFRENLCSKRHTLFKVVNKSFFCIL